tara:strand:- start:37 stop:153 length:117 start_codon:yes stop_codon:yes gene_type:complete
MVFLKLFASRTGKAASPYRFGGKGGQNKRGEEDEVDQV